MFDKQGNYIKQTYLTSFVANFVEVRREEPCGHALSERNQVVPCT